MPTYKVTLSEFQRILTKLAPDLEGACIRGLRSGALFLERTVHAEIQQAQPYPAIDRGELLASVDTSMVPDGAIVSVDAPHAGVMEMGARPFRPPLAPILEWVKRKGLHAGTVNMATRGRQGPLQRGEAGVIRRIRRLRAISRSARAGLNPTSHVARAIRKKFAQSVQDAAAMPIARAIVRSIEKKGIAPRHYFAKAVHRAAPMIRAEIDRELAKLGVGNVRSTGGGGSVGGEETG